MKARRLRFAYLIIARVPYSLKKEGKEGRRRHRRRFRQRGDLIRKEGEARRRCYHTARRPESGRKRSRKPTAKASAAALLPYGGGLNQEGRRRRHRPKAAAYSNGRPPDSRTDTPTSWAQGLFRDIRGLRVRVVIGIRTLSDKKEDTKKARTLLSEPILYLKF